MVAVQGKCEILGKNKTPEVLAEVCRAGLQTLTLFYDKTLSFATLFKVAEHSLVRIHASDVSR